MRRAGRSAVVVLLVFAVAACQTSKPPPDHPATNPDETAPSTVTTPATPSPTTAALGERVTAVDEAQRLLDLFARLDGDATRMLLKKGAPDAEFDQALQAVYVGQELELARQQFAQEANRNFSGFARPQPDISFHAARIEDARRNDCVVVRGSADFRPRYTNPVSVVDGAFVLVVQTGVASSGGNPTRWRMLRFGEQEPGSDLQGICPAL